MQTYQIIYEGGERETITAASLEFALEDASQRVLACDWRPEPDQGTMWSRVRVVGPDDETDTIRVRLDPAEPRCVGSEHEWTRPDPAPGDRNEPGIFAVPGGILVCDTCARCGVVRQRNTNGFDPETGIPGETIVYLDPQ